MLNGSLSDEIRGWRWVVHSVLESILIVTLLCAAGPLTLFLVSVGAEVQPQSPAAETSVG